MINRVVHRHMGKKKVCLYSLHKPNFVPLCIWNKQEKNWAI